MKANFYAGQTSPTPKRMTGAEAVIESLIAEKVQHIFGYPGGAIMPIYDALYSRRKSVEHILARHEQGAIHAAQGYARVSGGISVVFATSGPGATNLITGLADAMIDSTPVLCITGQVDRSLLGTDAFQETDVIGVSTPVTKWNHQITRAEDIPVVLAKAFYIAQSGRPGPVLIDITKNSQFGELDFQYKKCRSIRSYQPLSKLKDQQALLEATKLINNAKRPLVLWGQGVTLAKAEEEFLSFLRKSGMPAASTLLGLSALSFNDPQYVGMLGMHGHYAPNKLTNETDLIVAIGMRFDDRVTGNLKYYLPKSKVIHLEIDPAEINKNVYAHVPILGNIKHTLPALTQAIDHANHDQWIQQFMTLYKEEYKKVIHHELNPGQGPMSMGEVIQILNKKTKGESIIVTDVGQHQMVTCRYYEFKKKRSSITSGGLGTMGFCLPAAIGAKLAVPDRQVIAILGDGGFQMTLQELGIISQLGLNIKILILNNEFLGMVRQWQQLFFEKRYSFTELKNPDFPKLAGAYGIESKTIINREDIEEALEVFLNYESSYLLEVRVGKENNVFPIVPSGAKISDMMLEVDKQ